MDGIAGKGRRLFQAVCELDPCIVAKPISDLCAPETKWFKIPNHALQKTDRAELFKRQ